MGRGSESVAVGPHFAALNLCDVCYKGMDRYRLDDLIEYTLTKRGRENVALALLAVSCVAGIVTIGRL